MTVVIKYVREFSEYQVPHSTFPGSQHPPSMILVINGALTHINEYWIVETHILILRVSTTYLFVRYSRHCFHLQVLFLFESLAVANRVCCAA